MDTDLIRAFSYAKGWRAERIVRVLFPNLTVNSAQFIMKRQEVVKILNKTEKLLNSKDLKLMNILETSDEVLKKFYQENGMINLHKLEK